MNLLVTFLGVLLASFLFVALTTALAIRAGFLPGVEISVFRKRSTPTLIRHYYGEIAQLGAARTTATVIAKVFPSQSDAPLVITISFGDKPHPDAIVGATGHPALTFRTTARIYRFRAETITRLVEEAA